MYRRLPEWLRRRLRVVRREMFIRLRDWPADLRDRFRGADALPPAALRARVGADSSRAHFVAVGERVANDVRDALASCGVDVARHPRWLDFGCGAGRAARHFAQWPAIRTLTGVDVDRHAIAWASQHLRDAYIAIAPLPPMPFADHSFDVVVAISLFTHFDELQQFAWLAELHRVLAPGGILLATTHGPHLIVTRPDLTPPDHRRLETTGFTFRPGFGPFNDDSAFHTRAYLERTWSRWFALRAFRARGVAEYQDLGVWGRGATRDGRVGS